MRNRPNHYSAEWFQLYDDRSVLDDYAYIFHFEYEYAMFGFKP